MAKHTLKMLGYEHRKIFKECLAILQHYAGKGYRIFSNKRPSPINAQYNPKNIL